MSPEQAASIQSMLTSIERAVRSDAARMDASLSTHYTREQARGQCATSSDALAVCLNARWLVTPPAELSPSLFPVSHGVRVVVCLCSSADYFALLAQIDALDASTQPLSSIAFDSEALAAHAAATAASSSGVAPPAAPAASAATVASAPRFLSDLTRMSSSLKSDSAQLQSYLTQLSAHTKSSSKEFRREAETNIKLGSVGMAAQQQQLLQQQQQAQAKAQQRQPQPQPHMQPPVPLSRQQPMHR